jgi:hypothetical protein
MTVSKLALQPSVSMMHAESARKGQVRNSFSVALSRSFMFEPGSRNALSSESHAARIFSATLSTAASLAQSAGEL